MNGMTVSEAAEHLGVCEQRVYQLVGRGRIKAQRFGQRVLILDEDSVKTFKPMPAGRPRKTA